MVFVTSLEVDEKQQSYSSLALRYDKQDINFCFIISYAFIAA